MCLQAVGVSFCRARRLVNVHLRARVSAAVHAPAVRAAAAGRSCVDADGGEIPVPGRRREFAEASGERPHRVGRVCAARSPGSSERSDFPLCGGG